MAPRPRKPSTALVRRAGGVAPAVLDDLDDNELVEQVLEQAREIARRSLLDAVVEIGDLIVKRFFDGDLERARARTPNKEVAFRRLLKRAPAYDLSPGLLKRAVALSAQYRDLPAAVRDRLSTKHHMALLPVDDQRAKARLAEQAVSEDLSAAALAKMVRAQETNPARGRKPLTALEKAVFAARRALATSTLEADLSQVRLRRIPPERRQALVGALHAARERLELIADAVLRAKG